MRARSRFFRSQVYYVVSPQKNARFAPDDQIEALQDGTSVLYAISMKKGNAYGKNKEVEYSTALIPVDEGYLQIRRSARRTRKAQGGLLVTEPKTATSRRKIVLSPFLVEVLTKHRASQNEERQKVGARWTEQGMVFCNTYGAIIDPDDLTTWFKKQIKKADLQPMRFHDLRHSAATLLLAMGVHVKVVQELLGHSNIITTLNIYSHVLPSLQKEAMNKLSDLFDQKSRDDEQAE